MAHNLSNFNVYEVLEPLKCAPKDSNVGILIDINDETDNICKDLSGSDLDSIKKSEFDLVDLYQNIYVTPQLVKKPAEKTDTDFDFSDLFQTHELKQKTDMPENKNSMVHALSKADIEELLKRPDNIMKESCSALNEEFAINGCEVGTEKDWLKSGTVLVNGYLHNKQNNIEESNEKCVADFEEAVTDWIKTHSEDGNELDYNDIKELLNRPHIPREDDSGNLDKQSKFSDEIRARLDWIKNQRELKEALINELLKPDSSMKSNETTSLNSRFPNYNITKILKAPNEDDFRIGKLAQKLDDVPTTSDKETINKISLSKDNKFNIDSDNRKKHKLNSANATLESLYPNQFHISAVNIKNVTQKQNVTLLQTAKLNKKLYAKRHIHTNLQKLSFTKGPDLYEKSVVLPQILERLTLRKKVMEQEATLPRRLILDHKQPEQTGKSCNCLQKSNTAFETTTKKTTQQETKTINVNNTKANIASKEAKSTFKQTLHAVSKSGAAPSRDQTENMSEILNPIIAMEDCNRERLLAHRVRSAFEKFILTGSYY